jgi:Uma2 family endonuclease
MKMEAVLEPIYKSNNFYIFYEELKSLYDSEVKKRQRFYDEITESQKAEFINGEILMHSPVKIEHNQASLLLCMLMKSFVAKNHLGFVGIEKILVHLTRNDYEPDICFFANEKANKFKKGQMLFPAPDLVVEVLSQSTEYNDRVIKFDDYAKHGVNEYWIIDSQSEIIEQYLLNNGTYELLLKSNNGIINCKTIEGFEIPIISVFNENENLKALKELL